MHYKLFTCYCELSLTALSNEMTLLLSRNTFKARLDKFWRNQDVVYDFKAQLQGTGSRSECLYEES